MTEETCSDGDGDLYIHVCAPLTPQSRGILLFYPMIRCDACIDVN
jgi:hypothetical protein